MWKRTMRWWKRSMFIVSFNNIFSSDESPSIGRSSSSSSRWTSSPRSSSSNLFWQSSRIFVIFFVFLFQCFDSGLRSMVFNLSNCFSISSWIDQGNARRSLVQSSWEKRNDVRIYIDENEIFSVLMKCFNPSEYIIEMDYSMPCPCRSINDGFCTEFRSFRVIKVLLIAVSKEIGSSVWPVAIKGSSIIGFDGVKIRNTGNWTRKDFCNLHFFSSSCFSSESMGRQIFQFEKRERRIAPEYEWHRQWRCTPFLLHPRLSFRLGQSIERYWANCTKQRRIVNSWIEECALASTPFRLFLTEFFFIPERWKDRNDHPWEWTFNEWITSNANWTGTSASCLWNISQWDSRFKSSTRWTISGCRKYTTRGHSECALLSALFNHRSIRRFQDESFELIKQSPPSSSPIVIDMRAEQLNELIRSSKEALENQDSLTEQIDRRLDDMHRATAATGEVCAQSHFVLRRFHCFSILEFNSDCWRLQCYFQSTMKVNLKRMQLIFSFCLFHLPS